MSVSGNIIRSWPFPVGNSFSSKILLVRYDPSAVNFCVHSSPGGSKVKIVNNGGGSRYPSRSVEYYAIGSGPAVAECTLWEWAWLTKKKKQLHE